MFKDSVKEDLNAIFMNMDEFADTHVLDGTEVDCVAEGLTTDQSILKPNDFANYQDAYNQTIVVHIKTDDLPNQLITGNRVDFDDTTYTVASVSDDMGMTTLVLEVTGL